MSPLSIGSFMGELPAVRSTHPFIALQDRESVRPEAGVFHSRGVSRASSSWSTREARRTRRSCSGNCIRYGLASRPAPTLTTPVDSFFNRGQDIPIDDAGANDDRPTNRFAIRHRVSQFARRVPRPAGQRRDRGTVHRGARSLGAEAAPPRTQDLSGASNFRHFHSCHQETCDVRKGSGRVSAWTDAQEPPRAAAHSTLDPSSTRRLDPKSVASPARFR
jgi:hypothetical protein